MMQAFDKVRQIFEMRKWIMEGRGSYRYDDDRYKEEVRYMYDEFDALFKDTWANIKSKSFEYREKIIKEWKGSQGWISEMDKARFWSKVVDTGYCWEWQARKTVDGYGVFRLPKSTILSHRVAYQIINGVIDPTLQVLHKCDNPCCVCPDHLFTGTHADNMKDKQRKGRAKLLGRSSKFHGVSFRNDSKRWRSFIKYNGTTTQLGCFGSEIEAAKNRDDYVKTNNLDLPLNFPLPSPPIKEAGQK